MTTASYPRPRMLINFGTVRVTVYAVLNGFNSELDLCNKEKFVARKKKREIDTLKHHTLLISQKGARKDCNAIYQRLNDYCDVTLLLKVLILLKESTVSLKNPQLNI